MTIRFDSRVAIVTGAGAGLGRAHAIGLAARGAKVLVNDLGGADGAPSDAAQRVVDEIVSAGGAALANGANVADWPAVEAMAAQALSAWGQIDVLVNNAGILRDKSFVKMALPDFQSVLDVHLIGSVNCTKAVWGAMREQGYGRIAMTVSPAGLYGSFGQTNYAAAKMGLVGLMQSLHLEGAKYDIRVNALAPAALTRMTEAILDGPARERLTPEAVTAGLLYLVSADAPSRTILNAAGGAFSATRLVESDGVALPLDRQTPEGVAEAFAQITDFTEANAPEEAHAAVDRLVRKALSADAV